MNEPKEHIRTSRDLFGTQNPEVLLPVSFASAVGIVTFKSAAGTTDVSSRAELEKLLAERLKDSGAWAALAKALLDEGQTVPAYACARTGYHRGLDALRGNGWRGTGPVPWRHEPNRGVLAAIGALVVTAKALGEQDEVIRCLNLLHDCDPQAVSELGLDSYTS